MRLMHFAIAGATPILLAGIAFAGTADLAAIKAGCLESTNWPDSACQCMADKAGQMTDLQQVFLAATLNQDAAAATQLRLQMTIPQMTEAAMFVTEIGPSCFSQ